MKDGNREKFLEIRCDMMVRDAKRARQVIELGGTPDCDLFKSYADYWETNLQLEPVIYSFYHEKVRIYLIQNCINSLRWATWLICDEREYFEGSFDIAVVWKTLERKIGLLMNIFRDPFNKESYTEYEKHLSESEEGKQLS